MMRTLGCDSMDTSMQIYAYRSDKLNTDIKIKQHRNAEQKSNHTFGLFTSSFTTFMETSLLLSNNNQLQPNNSNNDNCNLYIMYYHHRRRHRLLCFLQYIQCSSILRNGKYHQVYEHSLIPFIFYAPRQIIYFPLLVINYFMFVSIFSNRLILQALAVKSRNAYKMQMI